MLDLGLGGLALRTKIGGLGLDTQGFGLKWLKPKKSYCV